MAKVLIIDDDAIRIPALSKYADWMVPGAEIVHSENFQSNWNDYELVMLDHDLGPGGDVYDHVRKAFPEGYNGTALIAIHSMNPVGARNIHAQVGGHIRPYSSILSFVSYP